MHRTRTATIGLLAAAAMLLTACSGGPGTSETADESSVPSASSAPGSTAAPGATDDASEPDASTSLLGVVGTADDPEAYEIALTDESGSPVTTLPAGDYSLTFVDRSTMHNFRLSGPGGVDVATDVAGTDESTVEVTLVEGTYEFVCDPHIPSMSGTVEVTG